MVALLVISKCVKLKMHTNRWIHKRSVGCPEIDYYATKKKGELLLVITNFKTYALEQEANYKVLYSVL